MSFHEEVLAPSQRSVLASLGAVMGEAGLYLGGGTAVALHLGHRKSVDFDWFAGKALGDVLVFAAWLQARGVLLAIEGTGPGTLTGRVRSVPVSVLEYPYPLIGEIVAWGERGFGVASLDDLAAMKLSAIAQRGAKKDFLDIYALVTQHRPLTELLDAYRRKFGIADVAHVLYGLTYFDDADRQPMPRTLWDVGWRTVKSSIREWTRSTAEGTV